MKKDLKEKGIFVVQKHNARNLHYDLRVEIAGVLKSWAIPKEPSSLVGLKRLAIETFDHSMDYADFEGEIEDGYGKGTVEIWDKGEFENLKEDTIQKEYEKGHIEILLNGKRLNGKFALIKFKGTKDKKDKGNNWLFFKMKE
jgi:DNA ligase D-like protein (predicted 3'-phosphoesterase)